MKLFLGVLLIVISWLFGAWRRYAMGSKSPIDVAPILRPPVNQLICIALNNVLLLGGFFLVFRFSIIVGFIVLFAWLFLKFSGMLRKTPRLLSEAAYNGDTETVKLLIGKRVDVNEVDWNWNVYPLKCAKGDTALYLAAAQGHTEIAKLLINNGADVNAKNSVGWTPLYPAAMFGHAEIVKLLIDNGTDVNVKDWQGNTPLHFHLLHAKMAGYTEEIANLLRQHGVKE